ncbi:MAG: hypothetical protein OXF61_15450 [Acidimicrobiaceae bacterium]|nr:hypothetical protein [Acidimicrobiaceae bacterium]
MTDIGEFDESMRTPRRKATRGRLIALLMALLLAATAMMAFSAGSASAQTQNDNGDSNQQQADDDADDSGGTCDRRGTRRGGGHWRAGASDTLTGVLGIDAEALRAKLKDGSTLADITAEQGVAVSDVVDALVTAVTDRAAEHDREIDVYAVTERITAWVNGEKPEQAEDWSGEGRRHGGTRFGGKGFGGHGHGSNAGAWSTST